MAKSVEEATSQPAKTVFIRLRGKFARTWLKMLADEGGTEQHHGLSALEDYCRKKKEENKP